jgi:hypothetical protein
LHPRDWIMIVDEHGCQRYEPRQRQTACCGCPREDAGINTDASLSHDASTSF